MGGKSRSTRWKELLIVPTVQQQVFICPLARGQGHREAALLRGRGTVQFVSKRLGITLLFPRLVGITTYAMPHACYLTNGQSLASSTPYHHCLSRCIVYFGAHAAVSTTARLQRTLNAKLLVQQKT